MTETKAKAPAKVATKAVKTAQYKFFRSGVVKGVSRTWKPVAGKVFEAPANEFDHLFNEDGSSRYCAKK